VEEGSKLNEGRSQRNTKKELCPSKSFTSLLIFLSMTTSVSTHITTHFAYIEKEEKKFPLTEEQAFQLREVLKNS
jgi:hypothetical protein